MTNIAIDAMGGDNAPLEIVKGAVDALNTNENINLYLCGDEDSVKRAVSSCGATLGERLQIVHCSETIDMDESPVNAIRRKKDSSIVKGLYLVKNKQCDAFVTAGSTGAMLVGGQVIVGKIKGVERAPLAPLIPTEKGASLLIDCGANVDARPTWLLQFAQMGSIYMQHALGINNPRVGILNIGAEEEKGNMLVKETFPLLKGCPDINFIGSIEARDIPVGDCDIIVCDAFTGNCVLKFYEGVGKTMVSELKRGLMSTTLSKIGALLVKNAVKDTLKKFDASEYGGAPLLGLNGLVVKTHGSAKAKEISNTVRQCVQFKEASISERICSQINIY